MPNDNYPRGLIPINWPNISSHWYRVSTAADIFLGEPVQRDSTGYIVGIGTPTGATMVMGVAVQFGGVLKRGLATPDPFLDVSDLTPPTPSSDTGDRWVRVSDDPSQEYFIQEDTGGTALALADAGAGIDLLYRGVNGTTVNGDVETGWSNIELDASTVATTTALLCVLQRLDDRVNSDGSENAVGDFAKWIVTFLRHQKAPFGVTSPLV